MNSSKYIRKRGLGGPKTKTRISGDENQQLWFYNDMLLDKLMYIWNFKGLVAPQIAVAGLGIS